MQDQRRRMGGLFYVVPYEVHDELEKTEYPQACRELYVAILRHIPIKEDWDTEGLWVAGRFSAPKPQIRKLSRVSTGHFYKVWSALTSASLIHETPDGTFLLPMYKKKSDAAYSARDIAVVRERVEQLEERSEEMLTLLQEMSRRIRMDEDHGQNTRTAVSQRSSSEVQIFASEVQNVAYMRKHPLKEKEEDLSLSGNKILLLFYEGIGQKKIAKAKRERGNGILKKLRQDGFTLEDIAFAVKWTLENAKQELYDFSIIEHTIGQAMAAKEKEAARETKRREEEAIRAKEQAQEQDKERIEAHKESLPPEERTALREKAEREIRKSGEFSEDFITDYLINIKENEILRGEIAEKADGEHENDV